MHGLGAAALLLVGARAASALVLSAPLRRVARRTGALGMAASSWEPGLAPDLLCLDFDGVVCDSRLETTTSGYMALRSEWASFAEEHGLGELPPQWFLDALGVLRPVVETGYENMLLGRLVVEERAARGGGDDVDGAALGSAVAARWGHAERDRLLDDVLGVHSLELVQSFGSVRDGRMAEDLARWAGENRLYPVGRRLVLHAAAAAAGSAPAVKIITTKQERFVQAILEHNGLPPFPEDDLFDLLCGPKTEVLKQLATHHAARYGREPRVVFVEDRVETLLKVAEDPELAGVELLLVDWGYNTPEQRAVAEAHERMHVISEADASRLADSWFGAPAT